MADSGDPADDPLAQVSNHWDDVLADAEATAAEYRADGWEVLELVPGDVTVLTGERGIRRGFDVVVPGDDAARLESLLADRAVDSVDAFRRVTGGMVFLLVAVEAADDLAVLLPLYYAASAADDLRRIGRSGGLKLFVRSLDSSSVVSVTVADPAPLLPPADAD